MTTRSDLEDLLGRLAQSGLSGQGGRTVRGGDPTTLRLRLLRFLDGVVMPRRITMTQGDTAIALDVANRRILYLDGNDATVDAVQRALDEVTMSARDVTVRSDPWQSGGIDPLRAGTSAEALATDRGLELRPSPPPDPRAVLQAILAQGGPDVLAWSLHGPDVDEQGGDPAHLSRLADLSRTRPALDPAERWAFFARTVDTSSCVVAEIGDLRLSLSISADRLVPLADEWRRLTAP